ncbi:MAG TPA: FtsQ-type POTRA domain-containing protein [Gemmatimonadales bacterium]|nr:FtsQ-type POTRA domain-containing protein [Gemmatimonadales bacterium]
MTRDSARRAGIAAALILGALLLVAAVPKVLSQASFFQVRRVEVVGARYLSGPEVVAALKLPKRVSLFDQLEPVERSARAIAGVRDASVRRRWPATLVVELNEAEPVALTQGKRALVLLDGNGRVLPFDPTRAPPDLPLAPADRAVARLLARIKQREPGLYRVVTSATRERQVIRLQAGDRRFLLRTDAADEQLRALAVVLNDLARSGRRFRELDARFTDRIFVRSRPS